MFASQRWTTWPCNYRVTDNMRMAMSVYFGNYQNHRDVVVVVCVIENDANDAIHVRTNNIFEKF